MARRGDTPAPTEAASPTLALLDHLARSGRRASEHLLETSGLRPRHVVALTLLAEQSASQQDLAELLRLDPSNLVGLLNELEDSGYVARRRDPADRRRHVVEISDAGRAELRVVQCRLASAEEHVLAALSIDERGQLKDLLMRAAGGHLPANACAAAASDEGDKSRC